MMLWMHVQITYQIMCITLKIQLLRLTLDFITLKSSEVLAALNKHVRYLALVARTCKGQDSVQDPGYKQLIEAL